MILQIKKVLHNCSRMFTSIIWQKLVSRTIFFLSKFLFPNAKLHIYKLYIVIYIYIYYIFIFVFKYIYIYVCVCVWVGGCDTYVIYIYIYIYHIYTDISSKDKFHREKWNKCKAFETRKCSQKAILILSSGPTLQTEVKVMVIDKFYWVLPWFE